MLCNLI